MHSTIKITTHVTLTCLLLLLIAPEASGNSGADNNPVVHLEIDKGYPCTYFYNESERYPTSEGGLVNCTWYSAKSCCKRTEVTSVFSNMDPLYGASVLCKNYINYLMCYFCSPDQYKFYKSNKKAMVCPDYCDALYEECKTAGFDRTLFVEKYDNGTAFCQAQDFEVVDSADCFKFDPDVFGSAARLFSLLWLYIIPAVHVFYFLQGIRT